MSNPETKVGVGQLAFTFALPKEDVKDEARETQGNGSQESPTALSSRGKPERKRKWHSLYDKVFALPNLERAWLRVAENNGAAGIS